jgi:hypothetical protein
VRARKGAGCDTYPPDLLAQLSRNGRTEFIPVKDHFATLDRQSKQHQEAKSNMAAKHHSQITGLKAHYKKLLEIVREQADEEVLWCIPDSIVEAYFQQELRRLHAAVEAAAKKEEK